VANSELTRAKQTIEVLWAGLDEAGMQITDVEASTIAAEQRFAATGDLIAWLFVEEKRQRTPAASERWPEPLQHPSP
jgi:hypothetical protein